MKKFFVFTALSFVLVYGSSCKDKDSDKTTNTTTTNSTTNTPATNTTPVDVAADDSLRRGVTDATKDITGLQTKVENGVIYLSGKISKADNMRITPTLNSLHPKSINRDNLTVE